VNEHEKNGEHLPL